MIPSKNEINCSQKIKIQLTSDNKCIIKSTIESAEKSKGTLNKSEYSINIPDLKDINDNELLTLSKSLTNNQINEQEANSNLLISFSNISELNKTGEKDLFMGFGIAEQNKNQNLNENKENIDINYINKKSFDSFSNYNNISDNNDLVNIKANDKSKCSDKSSKNNLSNKSKKAKENSNIIDFKKSINKHKNMFDKNNYIICNKKEFKNIKQENTDTLKIIHKKTQKEINDKNNNIIPNLNNNFSFGINNITSSNNNLNTNNYNDPIKNDDYASPTFNIKVNFNSQDSNKNNKNSNNNSNNKNESRNKNSNKNNITRKLLILIIM